MLWLIQLSHREFGKFLLGETHINISRILPLMRPGRSLETFEWEFLYSINNFQHYHVRYVTVSSALYQEYRYFYTYMHTHATGQDLQSVYDNHPLHPNSPLLYSIR